jgi:hypothetical protein
MNLKEKCEELGISLAEGKEKYGLTHWKQTVVETKSKVEDEIVETPYESCDEIPEVAEDVVLDDVVTAPIEIPSKEVSMDYKLKQNIGLGTKSPYWSELNG